MNHKTVLFIEDENLLNEAYQKQFGQKYNCLFATTGSEGLNLAQTKKPDLIILDLILPGGQNGFDVLRQLKQLKETKDIKVVVLTNLEDEKETVLEDGALDCLVKANTNMAAIAETIDKHLQ